MITFHSLGGATLSLEADKKTLLVFPKDTKGSATITFLANPEEDPTDGVISWPGEYDIDEVAIRGIGLNEGAMTAYSVEIDGARCGFIPSPLQDLSDHELELLGDIDILVIPADDAKIVQKLVDEIDPRVLIPLPTKDEATFQEVLKAVGAQGNEIVAEHKQKGMPSEGREVVILKPKK